jgi:hypothetical protein
MKGRINRGRSTDVGRALFLLAALLVAAGCGPATEPKTSELEIAESAPRGTSRLWGKSGELWSPSGRLPDFSYAGYHQGESVIPQVPVVANVRHFGAVGDGVVDDTRAFLDAIASVEEGALLIPAGRYRINEVLRIDKSNVVLRGAGRDETVLFFPDHLYAVEGQGPQLSPYGPYGWSWGGGFIWVEGPAAADERITTVDAIAVRGDDAVEVASVERIQPGQMIRLVQYESDGSLSLHLHAGHALSGPCLVDRPGFKIIDWAVRVERVEGNRLVFDRPLRTDVRPEWRPEIRSYNPSVREVGIEQLTVEFPVTEYNKHHKEPGYNAILFQEVFNGWVRDVAVVNFDSAIQFWYSRYMTGDGILLAGRGGHYGLNLGGCQDCLMTRFVIENQSVHDTSVSNLGNGNVFSRGKGPNINFDHHRGAAYENLFSDIDIGKSWRGGRRIFLSSGTRSGHFTAARETFWNLRPKVLARRLPVWPQINIIGPMRELGNPPPRTTDGWLEGIRRLRPRDLHSAQLARRLGRDAGDPPGLPESRPDA